MKPQRLDFTYCVSWDGNWHVGSGFASAAADRLIRRFGGTNGVPFVPGSQVKGVLRHQCERLATALGCETVDPHATSEEQRKRLVRHFQPLASSILIVDRLFGSRCQGECLFVDNALPVGDNRTATALRTRTAMDRVTGTVLERHLFTTELVHRASPTLEGQIHGRHAAGVLTQDREEFPFEYALLLAAALCVDRLGGDKSAGLGRCRFSIKDNMVRWNQQPLALDVALASFKDLGADWTDMVRLIREERH